MNNIVEQNPSNHNAKNIKEEEKEKRVMKLIADINNLIQFIISEKELQTVGVTCHSLRESLKKYNDKVLIICELYNPDRYHIKVEVHNGIMTLYREEKHTDKQDTTMDVEQSIFSYFSREQKNYTVFLKRDERVANIYAKMSHYRILQLHPYIIRDMFEYLYQSITNTDKDDGKSTRISKHVTIKEIDIFAHSLGEQLKIDPEGEMEKLTLLIHRLQLKLSIIQTSRSFMVKEKGKILAREKSRKEK